MITEKAKKKAKIKDRYGIYKEKATSYRVKTGSINTTSHKN